MPFCYGGGIKNIDQAKKILSLGVEKISLSSAVFENPELVSQIVEHAGSQSVVISIDVKKNMFSGYGVFTHNGKKIKN